MRSSLPSVGPDIGPILSLVRKTRLLLRGSWGTIGAGFTLGLAFSVLALVTAADMLVPLVAPWLRLVGLVLFAVPTLVVFVSRGMLPLSRRLRNVEVARRIESKIPGMHSRLVSCMDLASREGEVSPAFYRKLVNESLERIGKYRTTSVVDFRRVRKAMLFALAGAGIFAILWLGFGAKLTTALSRVFYPFADLPPVSDVAYTVEPGTTKVLTGEDVNFAVSVTRGEPETLSLELVGTVGTVRHPLKKESDGIWRLSLRGLSAEKGLERGFTYRVFGGRTWTKLNRIDWAERPVILDTQVKLFCPEYMAIPEPRANLPKERDVVGPAGSRVEVAVTVEGEIAAGEIQLLEARVKRTPNPDRSWFTPAVLELREYIAGAKYPLQPAGDHLWIGSFPLNGSGQYRVELRNELGHANYPASELPRYEAIADQPPIVQIDRPGDLVLSKPDKVAVTIGARDDFGLLDLWIATQKAGESKFTRTVKVKEYATPNPLKADALVAMLDLTPGGLDLRAGETLRYRAEVRDRRPNSEAIFSKDFTIRITEDPNAADKQIDAFDKGQDAVRNKLTNLIAEQKKVKEKIDQLAAKNDVNLRKELTDLHAQERKNVAAATALDQELKNLAAQAQTNSLLNGAINKEMQNLASQFKNATVDPLADLASKLQQGSDLKSVKNQSDRVQKNLEAMKSKMDALAEAQKGIRGEAEKALAKLKDDLLKEQGKMTAGDLAELKEFLKNVREELAKMQGKQEDLVDKTEKSADKELPEVEQKQLAFDEMLKQDLDLAKKVLDRESAKGLRKPESPDDAKKSAKAEPGAKPERKTDVEDDLFKPALKGEGEKPDPRFDRKIRQIPKRNDKRDDLRDHQQDNLRNLDAAQKGLKSDEQTLDEMIQSLMNASQKGQQTPPNDPKDKSQTDKLSQILKSEAIKNALQMAQRAKQDGKGQPQQGQPENQPPTGTATESLSGNSLGGLGSLDELDPRTRATILQLPARVREELLQGMKTQGPDGYQKFIQDYFRRLAEAK
jgi:hypothetical protein